MLLILKVCDRSQAVDQDHLRGSRGGQGFFSALSLQTRSGGFVDRMGRLLDDIFGESEQIDKARGNTRPGIYVTVNPAYYLHQRYGVIYNGV